MYTPFYEVKAVCLNKLVAYLMCIWFLLKYAYISCPWYPFITTVWRVVQRSVVRYHPPTPSSSFGSCCAWLLQVTRLAIVLPLCSNGFKNAPLTFISGYLFSQNRYLLVKGPRCWQFASGWVYAYSYKFACREWLKVPFDWLWKLDPANIKVH